MDERPTGDLGTRARERLAGGDAARARPAPETPARMPQPAITRPDGDLGDRARDRHAHRGGAGAQEAVVAPPVEDDGAGQSAPVAHDVASRPLVDDAAGAPDPVAEEVVVPPMPVPLPPVHELDRGDGPLPVAEDDVEAGDLIAQADRIVARLDRGEIDPTTHDAELQQLVERADVALADPTPVMEIAERIRDADLREWAQAGILGRYAGTQEFADDELAGFALELETPAGIDGFLAGLPAGRRPGVRVALDARTSVPDADPEVDAPEDPAMPEPPVDDLDTDDRPVARAWRIGDRLERGEIDEASHDRELQAIVDRSEPTQEAMDVAGRIRDPDLREWTQAGILGRNADAQDDPTEELARLAVGLATDARVDAFLAGLSPDKRAGVLDVLGERSQWPVAHTTGWTPADRELFREVGTVSRELQEGVIDDAAHDARLQRLAAQADPAMAGWEITHHIRDPVARAETRADLAAAVARAGDQTMAWGMVESIAPEIFDARGRRVRSRALADLANATGMRTAVQEFIDGIDDPATRDEVHDILSDADTLPP